jgi:glycosyltransferase involved in cell wall biosynthesis
MGSAKSPLVTVIIPCYNVDKTIECALQSILDQTYDNLEILIVDDASTDETRNRLKKYEDERIKTILLTQNSKKIGAVNVALEASLGDYITFQDGDDWSDHTRIEKQITAFQKDLTLGLCFTRDNRVDGDKKIESHNVALAYDDLKCVFVDFMRNESTFIMPACATGMISREVYMKIGGYHPYFAGRVGEDIYFFYRILREFKGICLDEALYNYRFSIDGFTGKQLSGVNAKYVYSWELLSRIILIENTTGDDFFKNTNESDIVKIELDACESVLKENVRNFNGFRELYCNSLEFRIGYCVVFPFRQLKRGRTWFYNRLISMITNRGYIY